MLDAPGVRSVVLCNSLIYGHSLGVKEAQGVEDGEQLGLVGVEPGSRRSSVAKPVRRLKMRSNRARNSAVRRLEGCRL